MTASQLLVKSSSEGNFSFQSVSRNEKIDSHSMSLLDWIHQNGNITIEGLVENSIDQKTGLKEIQFSLSGKLVAFYSLLRGIAASGQPQSLWLQTNHKEKTFTFKFDASAEEGAKEFLTKVLKILEDEARFKQVLRKIIKNQEKFKLEEKLLLNELS